jgi:hypothetical protein
MPLTSLLKQLAMAGARAAVDQVAEWITGTPRDVEPARGMSHTESERIAEITRNAGRCPRCKYVHPSDRACPPTPKPKPDTLGDGG